MQLTFDRFQEPTDLKGKTFLDLEMTLTLSDPKRVRLRFSIPATEEPDQQALLSFAKGIYTQPNLLQWPIREHHIKTNH